MIINGLSEALLTTPEWLTGLSDEKEFSTYTLCQAELEKHAKYYLGMQSVPYVYDVIMCMSRNPKKAKELHQAILRLKEENHG